MPTSGSTIHAWNVPLNNLEIPMSKDPLVVVNPDPKKHVPEMFDMCAKVFSKGMSYFGCYTWCKDAYIMNSHYDWKSSAIGLIDNRIVTHFGIWDYTMRIGHARVRVGGVGLVATHGDYRRHGYMGITANKSLAFMAANGYDFSLLFGIAGYYDRFGFVPSWDSTEYCIESHHFPKVLKAPRLYKFAPRHRQDLADLYNRENATRTGTAVRPTFLRSQWPGKWSGYLWKDARGKVAGYVVVSQQGDDILRVIDCAGPDDQSFAVLGTLVRKFHLKSLSYSGLHYDAPLRKRLTSQSYSWAKVNFRTTGGPMICIINLESALGKLTSEFNARLKRSALAGWKGLLIISDGRTKVGLAIDRSRVTVVPPRSTPHRLLGNDHVARLLIGSTDPADVIQDAHMKLSGDASKLAEVLFPNQHPLLETWDRF